MKNLFNVMNDAASNSVEICRLYMNIYICVLQFFLIHDWEFRIIVIFISILIHCFDLLNCCFFLSKYVHK